MLAPARTCTLAAAACSPSRIVVPPPWPGAPADRALFTYFCVRLGRPTLCIQQNSQQNLLGGMDDETRMAISAHFFGGPIRGAGA